MLLFHRIAMKVEMIPPWGVIRWIRFHAQWWKRYIIMIKHHKIRFRAVNTSIFHNNKSVTNARVTKERYQWWKRAALSTFPVSGSWRSWPGRIRSSPRSRRLRRRRSVAVPNSCETGRHKSNASPLAVRKKASGRWQAGSWRWRKLLGG